jgi:hypothetical protein
VNGPAVPRPDRQVVRPAAADAESLGRVHIQVWRETYVDLMPSDYLAGLSAEASAAGFRTRLADPAPDTRTLVGLLDGLTVGFASAGFRARAFYARHCFAPDGVTRPHPGSGAVVERWLRG